VVTNGTGILNKSSDLETIKKGDVVYITGNAEHALKNDGKETLEFYWIFPTNRFSEIEYFPSKQKGT
jgi:oxalate decarboxylase/phosphoglucose isomerase-like protein (cupin superfamily)